MPVRHDDEYIKESKQVDKIYNNSQAIVRAQKGMHACIYAQLLRLIKT